MPKTPTKGRACDGKRPFSSKTAAENAIRDLARTAGAYAPGLKAYRCGHCPNWHFGHKGRKRR